MTHEENVRKVWADEEGLKYYSLVHGLCTGEFVNWWELSTIEEVFQALDPVLYSNRPAELAKATGLSRETIFALRKQCHRKSKPSLATTLRIVACGVSSLP